MSLFTLTPTTIPDDEAPFFWSMGHCDHPLDMDQSLRASAHFGGGVWRWGAVHRYIQPDVPEEIEFAETAAKGEAESEKAAIVAASAWMRGRL